MVIFRRLLLALTASASLVLAAPRHWPADQTPLGNSESNKHPHPHAVVDFPSPSHATLVKPVLNTLSVDNLRNVLTTYTAFPNRRMLVTH
jgi:hypothetical protein